MICKICEKEYNSYKSLSIHIRKTHNITSKEYYDKYIRKENEGNCVTCGKPTPYKNISSGYQIHCSNRCTRLDPVIKNQIENTHMQRYGVPHAFNMQKTKENSHSDSANKKRKNTCLEHFGVEHQFESEIVKQKSKQTLLENYNVENPGQSEEIKEKIKHTNRERYGVDWVTQSKEVIDKIKKTLNDHYDVENPWQIKDNIPIMQAKAKNTTLKRYGVKSILQLTRVRSKIRKIRSKYEDDIINSIRQIYDSTINNNVLDIISPYELDIYLPELKLAVEYNGNYWHSSINKHKNYHLIKSLLCREKGIRLIYISMNFKI